jgi:hypothetical protein
MTLQETLARGREELERLAYSFADPFNVPVAERLGAMPRNPDAKREWRLWRTRAYPAGRD